MTGTASRNTNVDLGRRSHTDHAFLISVAGAVVALDYATKTWITRHLSGRLDGVNPNGPFTLAVQQNRAGAFGLLTGANPALTRIVFSLLSLVSIAALLWLYLRLKPRRYSFRCGLPLVLGGALGNLLDRVRFGYVVDFIDLHVLFLGVQRRMSRFNLADAAITIGVAMMAAEVLRHRGTDGHLDRSITGPPHPTSPP